MVDFCNWCPVPSEPSRMHHPTGAPRHELRPQTWAQTAHRLRRIGWEVTLKPAVDAPPYLWRAPDGKTAAGFRSDSPDSPPEAVMRYAYSLGHVDFLWLG